MENKNQSAGMELPQLRQMVLEITQRINRNELKTHRIRMDKEEFDQRMRKHDEWLEKMERLNEQSRLEHEKEMREWKAYCKKRDEKFDADFQKSRESHEKYMAELKERDRIRDEKFDADFQKSRESHEKAMQKWNASLEKLEKNVNKAVESVNKLSAEFHSVVGHIVEGLLGPNGHDMFMKAGFAVDRFCKDMHRKIKALNLEMEVDVLSYGDDLAIATEVKTNCRKTDIDEFLDKMQRFKTLFTEHKDKEVIAAIAAVNFERDAYEYAQKQGILIIHVIDESIFTIDPIPDKRTLRRF